VVDELAAPLGYDSRWSILLGALTLVPVLLLVGRTALRIIRRPGSLRISGTERSRVLALIDDIPRAAAAGEIAPRAAHSRLSSVVRDFVSASGSRVDGKTLRDLESSGADETLLEAVRLFYGGTFDGNPTVSVEKAARAAHRVVAEWKN